MPAYPLPHPWIPGTEEAPFEARLQENQDKIAKRLGELTPLSAPGTTFPINPHEGQKFTYIADATNGVLWSFEYHATGSAYDWWFVGGAALLANVNTFETRTNTSFGDLATVGPTVTAPLAGDYEVSFGSHIRNDTVNQDSFVSFSVGASAATDADGVQAWSASATVAGWSETKTLRKTGIAAASALTLKYRSTGGTASYRNRWLRIQPVRVG